MKCSSPRLVFFTPALQVLAVALTLVFLEEAPAATLYPGDILVADSGYPGVIIRVNPLTGGQAIVATFGPLEGPMGVAFGTNGDLFVSNSGTENLGTLVEIDPATGNQNVINLPGEPGGIAFGTNGEIMAAEFDLGGELVGIDPATQTQTVISVVTVGEHTYLDYPQAVAVATNGTVYVSNNWGYYDVVAIDPVTGVQTPLGSNVDYRLPEGVAVSPDGSIYLADFNMSGGNGGVFRVDPTSGQETLLASGGILQNPRGIAIDGNGKIVVSDYSALAIVRVDPSTGAQSVICTNGLLQAPEYITVVPGVPQVNEESNHVPPSVSILSPTNGTAYPPDTDPTISIVASATAYDGAGVGEIEFFVDGTLIGATTSNPATFFYPHPALGTHAITAAAIDSLLATNTSAITSISVTATNSPAGTWLTAITGADKGVELLTFNDDFTLSGFGFRVKTFGLDQVSGQWNFNSNGQVTGTLIEQSGGTTNWNGIVLATIRDSRILKATVATTSGLFQWKGVPATTFPDLSGIWTGVVKVGKSPTTTSYLIESNSNGLFDIFPSTSTDTMIGQLLVGESDKIYGDLMIDGETFALSGTYNSRRASLVIAGIDVGREKISLKIVKQ